MADDVFGIVGTTVAGAFQVEAVVAEGGFAVVYRAYHAGFRAPVALKCLKIPQYMSADEQDRFEQQFRAEAELLFKLSASIPTVVRPLHVESVITPDGSFVPFLALEWLDGETLDAVCARRTASGQPPFSMEELVRLLTPVARALERAHNFVGPEGPISIVHRDMKPENIFLARMAGENVVKVLDFGIGKAKSVASQVAGRASQGDVGIASFTPAYGAPEQWAPKRYGQTGPWTDVWGLALTMVELLVGHPVIDGDTAAMMGTVLDPGRRPSPRTEGVPVGDAVEEVFLRALAVDPRQRYAHAGEFWNALLSAHAADAGPPAPRGPYSAAGRSGAPAMDPALGRELVPDLVPPGGSRPQRELTIELAEPARPSSSPPPAPPSVRPPPREPSSGTGGQWPAARGPAAPGSNPTASPGRLRGAESSSVPPRNEASPISSRARSVPPPAAVQLSVPEGSRELVERFWLPAALIVVGVLTTVGDGAYAASNGEVFTLGPLRLVWIAGAFVVAGIALALYRLLDPD